MRPALAQHPALGFGVHIWHSGVVRETITHWPDGEWLILLWEGGLVGLALSVAALHLIPAGLALARPPDRPSRLDAGAPAWGLVLFSVLHLTDSLHNPSRLLPTALIAGALVGRALDRPSIATANRRVRNGSFPESLRPTIAPRFWQETRPSAANRLGPNLVRLAVVLILLATPEILDAAWRFWNGPIPAEESQPMAEPIRKNRETEHMPLRSNPGG